MSLYHTESAHKEEGSLLDTALGKAASEKLKGSTEKIAQQVSKVAPLGAKKPGQHPKSVPAPDDFFDTFLTLEPKGKQGQSQDSPTEVSYLSTTLHETHRIMVCDKDFSAVVNYQRFTTLMPFIGQKICAKHTPDIRKWLRGTFSHESMHADSCLYVQLEQKFTHT
jgi:hypothetical protein